jgi:hypothetical protein
MKKPPNKIDKANVLEWAWSGSIPFGKVGETDIFGLAICQYENSDEYYRFSCDKNWETEQDGLYDSVEEAKNCLPEQYKNVPANWIFFE